MDLLVDGRNSQPKTGIHEDSRGSSWIVSGTTWIRRLALAIGGASWTLTLSSTSSTRPQLEEAVHNGLFPLNTPLFLRLLSYQFSSLLWESLKTGIDRGYCLFEALRFFQAGWSGCMYFSS
jgi:hypothetical protein